jgi:hypothetical protein
MRDKFSNFWIMIGIYFSPTIRYDYRFSCLFSIGLDTVLYHKMTGHDFRSDCANGLPDRFRTTAATGG